MDCVWCEDGTLMVLVNPNCKECKGDGTHCSICIPKGKDIIRLAEKDRIPRSRVSNELTFEDGKLRELTDEEKE